MFKFIRVHFTGTEAILTQSAAGWRIQINLKEPDRNPMTIVATVPTFELAQRVSDKEVFRYGHVCNGSCTGWEQTLE